MEGTPPTTLPTDDGIPDAVENRPAGADAQVAERMAAAGAATTETARVDYFGTDEIWTVVLPDGVSTISHKKLDEGSRRRYLNESNRDVERMKATGNAKMSMRPGDERMILLREAIVDWDLVRRNARSGQMEQIPCTKQEIARFLENGAPEALDAVEKDVRAKNVWLNAELSIEAIDEQIAELNEMRERLVKEQEGKAGSNAT